MKLIKITKMFSVILLAIVIIISIPTKIYASAISNSFDRADDFLSQASQTGDSPFNDTSIKESTDTIYNVLLVIGIIAAVIIGIFLEIQFITESVEQKGKIKESLIPYLVGCIVIFGAFGIWKLVITILR